MAYGRAHLPSGEPIRASAAVSHLAELVRGDCSNNHEGPLIRPSGTFSPRGEGTVRPLLEYQPRARPHHG
jgi:hypothetical protein